MPTRAPTQTQPSRKRLVIPIGLLLVLLIGGTLAAFFNLEPAPNIKGKPFHDYLARADRFEVAVDLAKITPDPIHHLAAAARTKSTFWQKLYGRYWSDLPQSIRRRLASPDQSEFVQSKALRALGYYGEDALQALPVVLEVAQDAKNSNRAIAMDAALRIAANDPRVNEAFVSLLRAPATHHAASGAIRRTGQYPSSAVKALLPLDWSNPAQPPYSDLLALRALGTQAISELPMIIQALENPEKWGQADGNLLHPLPGMGRAASAAIPALIKRLDPGYDSRIQVKAIRVLAGLGPEASHALPALEPLLSHDNPGVQCASAFAIARISNLTEPCVEALVSVLETPDPGKSYWNCETSIQYGFSNMNLNTPQTVAWVISEVAPHPLLEPAMLHLREAYSSNQRLWLTGILARALWRQDGRAEDVLPTLITLLGTETDPFFHLFACHTLREMGPAAAPAVPALRAAFQNDLITRNAAKIALEAIVD